MKKTRKLSRKGMTFRSSPKVSVLMLAHNHERFIAQAIESVLMQSVSFDYDIVVGNDSLADGTAAILKCFQQKYPGKIRVQQAERIGMHENFARTLALCRGEYVALLEGDDYWTSPDKLQMQVKYLDEHRDCALCFHQVQLIGAFERAAASAVFPTEINSSLKIEDLLKANPIPTCSVVFRRKLIDGMPGWASKLKMVDWPLFILLAQFGKAGFIENVMGAYRIHAGGLWTQTSQKGRSEAIVEMLRNIDSHFGGNYAGIIRRRLAQAYFHISWCDEEQNRLDEALKANWKAIAADVFGSSEYKMNWIRLWMSVTFPQSFSLLQRLRSKTDVITAPPVPASSLTAELR